MIANRTSSNEKHQACCRQHQMSDCNSPLVCSGVARNPWKGGGGAFNHVPHLSPRPRLSETQTVRSKFAFTARRCQCCRTHRRLPPARRSAWKKWNCSTLCRCRSERVALYLDLFATANARTVADNWFIVIWSPGKNGIVSMIFAINCSISQIFNIRQVLKKFHIFLSRDSSI